MSLTVRRTGDDYAEKFELLEGSLRVRFREPGDVTLDKLNADIQEWADAYCATATPGLPMVVTTLTRVTSRPAAAPDSTLIAAPPNGAWSAGATG